MEGITVAFTTYAISAVISMGTAAIMYFVVQGIKWFNKRSVRR